MYPRRTNIFWILSLIFLNFSQWPLKQRLDCLGFIFIQSKCCQSLPLLALYYNNICSNLLVAIVMNSCWLHYRLPSQNKINLLLMQLISALFLLHQYGTAFQLGCSHYVLISIFLCYIPLINMGSAQIDQRSQLWCRLFLLLNIFKHVKFLHILLPLASKKLTTMLIVAAYIPCWLILLSRTTSLTNQCLEPSPLAPLW